MKLIMENWRLYNTEADKQLNIIKEINKKAFHAYGLRPDTAMTQEEQIYILNELGFEKCNEDAMHAMIICGLIKNNSGQTILKEQLAAALSFLRAGWNSVKFFEFMNTLVNMAADKVGAMRYKKELQNLKDEIAQECATKFDIDRDSQWTVGHRPENLGPFSTERMVQMIDTQKFPSNTRVWAEPMKDWGKVSDQLEPYQKCVLFKPPVPPEIEELNNSTVEKITESIKSIFAKIKKMFHKLIAYVAAVAIYKTFKPSEEEKILAAPIAETILVFICSGVSLYIIGAGLVFGSPWWQMVLGGIFAGLEIFGAYKELKSISKMPNTPEEAKEEIKRLKELAGEQAIEEIESKQGQAA